MKGSMWRWKWDARRVWECPICNRKEKTGGHVVSRLCSCGEKAEPPQRNWMRLIEERKAPRGTGADDLKIPNQGADAPRSPGAGD